MTNVFVKTYGCSLNFADGEALQGILQKEGFNIVAHKEEADVVVFNSCTVKNPTEQKLQSELQTTKQKIVLAGCVPQADDAPYQHVVRIGTNTLNEVGNAVRAALTDTPFVALQKNREDRLSLPKLRAPGPIDIIPINQGCLSNCSFCKTKKARGALVSHPPRDILRLVREGLQEGKKEFYLTSPDTGAYGRDLKTNSAKLLQLLVKEPENYRLRLGMGNPEHFTPIKEELVEALKNPKVYKFLHIPVQSGSDSVLQAMQRRYTVQEFKDLVTYLRTNIPDLTLATDIIVGYPTEKEEDFQQSMQLIESLSIPVVNISKFYPRPGTRAAKLKALPNGVSKDRSARMTALCKEVAKKYHEQWQYTEGTVLISQEGKQGTVIARNNAYIQVILPYTPLGNFVKARATQAHTHYVQGELC